MHSSWGHPTPKNPCSVAFSFIILPFPVGLVHNARDSTTFTYMGGYVGKAAEHNHQSRMRPSAPPLPNEPVRHFAQLSKSTTDSSLSVEACPLNEVEGESLGPVGPYNALSLAGRALSLSASLSPDYCQAYLAGLEDLSALRALPDGKRKKRR